MTDGIFDTPSIFARAWYATMRVETDPAAAVEAALVSVASLLSPESNRIDDRMDRLLFCWDGKKAPSKGRAEKPEHYKASMQVFREMLTEIFGAEHSESVEHEADDAVATAAEHSDADEVYVISGDKDLTQLQGDRVHYYCLHTKAVLTTSYICRKWGVKHPSQVAIALAIIGDPVDGIKGIPKWGPVKCKQLFTSVRPQMNFVQAFQVIEAQVPDNLREPFYDSLERTLLERNLPGLPLPAHLKLASLKEVRAMEMPDFYRFYVSVYSRYGSVGGQ